MQPTTALSAPVQPFPFHDTTLDVARDNGDLWVSIRRVCEGLAIAHQPQFAKLKGRPWARVTFIVTHDTSGRRQQAAMIHLDALPMWLATIEPSRVAEAARPRLELFQIECARVLRDHFFGKPKARELHPWEVELPKCPTQEQYAAKRDALAARAWAAMADAAQAAHDAWAHEDRDGRAVMWSRIAKLLREVPKVEEESPDEVVLDRRLGWIVEQVLIALWSIRRARSASDASESAAIIPV